jgi:hypothetical protein
MSIGQSDAVLREGARWSTALRPLLLLLASEEALLLSYVVAVLSGFKTILHLTFILAVTTSKWRYNSVRLVVWVLLSAAPALYYAKAANLIPAVTFSLALTGIFSKHEEPNRRRDPVLEFAKSGLLLVSLLMLIASLAIAGTFSVEDATASRNFIPIVGLYLLLVAEQSPRAFRITAAFVLAICALLVGSRTGAAALLVVAIVLVPRRWAPAVIVGSVLLLVGAASITAQVQFQRNYELSSDPRLLIWSEVAEAILNGRFYRTEEFDFMTQYGLARNFHNSLLEAYYRVGPFCLLLLGMHLRSGVSARSGTYRKAVLVALLIKSMTDTFLWFTPVDLILYRRYGEQL